MNRRNKVNKILWLSRHKMTDEQFNELREIYGQDITIKQYTGEVGSWSDVVNLGEDCDILAVVLPLTIITDLVNPKNNIKPVIRSIGKKVVTDNTVINPITGMEEKIYAFQHLGWERVIKSEVVTERLLPKAK